MQKSVPTEDSCIVLPPRLTAETSAPLWSKICRLAENENGPIVAVDASNLVFSDESGLTLLYKIRKHPKALNLINVPASIENLYEVMLKNFSPALPAKKKLGFIEILGRWLDENLKQAHISITFLGRTLCALAYIARHPSFLRPKEILSVADETGSKAVAIVCLIGFLMGIIIAFETALVAKIFGAVIFVVNGIGIAMTRELGPLMTAILFAGRSGSAFAAQLGTQKVNEELNALTTFGLNPIYFLVAPRVISSSFVVPLLSVFATILGILGGGLVMAMYDITYTQFYVQLLGSVSVTDVVFGLIKAVIFGFVIALIGCQCGMNTGAGAAAVGASTTRSVVKAIVWIVVIDGAAALLMNRLGI